MKRWLKHDTEESYIYFVLDIDSDIYTLAYINSDDKFDIVEIDMDSKYAPEIEANRYDNPKKFIKRIFEYESA